MPITMTPLRYPGGKSKYLTLFAEILELNAMSGCTFAEAFAGGAGAAVSLLLKGHVSALILNDLDVPIYSFWKTILEMPEEFIRLIRQKRVSIAEWRRQKAVYDSCRSQDSLELGFAAFYLNRCNRSGILGARPIGGMSQQGGYSISSRFNKQTAIEKITAIADRAACIDVHCMDGRDFVKMLEARKNEPPCLLYLDPPYYQKGPGLYLNHFAKEDHAALRDVLLSSSLSWVLSYDVHPEIMGLYEHTTCRVFSNRLRHTVCGNHHAEELIITRLDVPQSLIAMRAPVQGVPVP